MTSNNEIHKILDREVEATIAEALKHDIAWFNMDDEGTVVGGYEDGELVCVIPLNEPHNFEVADEFMRRAMFG